MLIVLFIFFTLLTAFSFLLSSIFNSYGVFFFFLIITFLLGAYIRWNNVRLQSEREFQRINEERRKKQEELEKQKLELEKKQLEIQKEIDFVAKTSYLPNVTDYTDDDGNTDVVYLYYNYINVNIVRTDFIKNKTGLQNLKKNQQLHFRKDIENEVNKDAILFVDENEQPIGYVSKGHIQNMINDYIKKKLVVVALVINPHKLLVEIGFYQFKPYAKIVSLASAKSEYQDNLLYCSKDETVTIESDWDNEKVIVYSSYGDPIGTIRNEEFVDCKAYIHSLEETDSGKTKVKIAVLP